jgi:fumarate hydratase subunit alpha
MPPLLFYKKHVIIVWDEIFVKTGWFHQLQGVINIREVNVSVIKKSISDLCIQANCDLGDDVVKKLHEAMHNERSPVGREILEQLIQNAEIAQNEEIPMCQDTGFAIVFLEIGQEVHLVGGDLETAVNEGVREGYTKGFLRKSMVRNPLNRVNTGDNTPAIIHTTIVPGDQIRITVAPKGGGSENMSSLKMLKPAEGEEGIKSFIIETVKNAGPNPCPPIVVGVGIGGNMEKAALMAKHALTRNLGEKSPDQDTVVLEQELLKSINKLGIGPQGFGGLNTALAVHIETYPTHIASLPVAVNIGCHAYRHKTIII